MTSVARIAKKFSSSAKKTAKKSGFRSVSFRGVKVSLGNSKLGKIANVSLPPIVACVLAAAKLCGKSCYAKKAYVNYPTAKNAWDGNFEVLQNSPAEFFQGIRELLAKHNPEFFRWWVSGDTRTQEELDEQIAIAREFPTVKFLMFTKNHALNFRKLPENFVVVFSMWPGYGNTRKKMPRAWMDDGTDRRIPDEAFECAGNCERCMVCWHLPTIGVDVVFKKH